MTQETIGGTFECPVCGKDSPHTHPVGTVRWYGDHLDRFMLAVNNGEPKDRYDWGGTYPDPKEPDQPPRFRQAYYQRTWEVYCYFVRVGLIPARPTFPDSTAAVKDPNSENWFNQLDERIRQLSTMECANCGANCHECYRCGAVLQASAGPKP